MPQVVKLKRSGVAGRTPAVGDLTVGELAVNYHDGTLFTKIDTGDEAVVQIAGPAFVNDTPTSSSASGIAGQVKWDTSYLYICVATDTWKRVALSSF